MAAISNSCAASYGTGLALAQDRAASYGSLLAVGNTTPASYGSGLAVAASGAASYATGLAVVQDRAASYGTVRAIVADIAASYGTGQRVTGSVAASYGTDLPYVFWALADPTLDATTGTTLELSLRVASSGAGVDTGVVLAIFDGAMVYMVWLREASVNVQGHAAVAVDLSDVLHRVRVLACGNEVRVYVDGALLQTGGPVGVTAEKGYVIGSWVSPEFTFPASP